MLQPPDSYNGAKRGRCRHGGSRRAGTASNGAIVIPALAGTIGLAAALVIGSSRAPRGCQRPACHPPKRYGGLFVRTAASLRRAIVVTAVSFLAANAALVFPAPAVWRAHDTAGHFAASGPGTHDRARAGRPAPGAHQRAACGRPVAPPAPDARLAAALTRVLRDHAGRVAVGVTDQATGVTAIYHGTESFDTASIVKADILAVLLLQLQQAGKSIGAADRQLAALMIKDSDNAAASALWDARGGRARAGSR